MNLKNLNHKLIYHIVFELKDYQANLKFVLIIVNFQKLFVSNTDQ